MKKGRMPFIQKYDLRVVAGLAIIAALLSYGLYSVLVREAPASPPEDPPVSEVPEDPTEPEEPVEPTEPEEPIIPDLPGALIVSIDNKVEARPHTGLEHADMIIEVLAEWRITRLIAFYFNNAVPVIGPVRSTRYYGAQLVAPYNSPFAHAGGSTDGLQAIKDLAVPDLDEINNSSAAFWRDSDRFAPHNLYTSTDRMLAQAERRRLNLTPMPELPVGQMSGGLDGTKIGIVYSQRDPSRYLIDYRVDWWWEEGAYHRYMNSLPHVTTDGVHLTADNVIVLLVNHRDLVAATWRTEMDLVGSGESVFFRDGQAYIGSWSKSGAKAHFEYTVGGEPYQYAKGTTWIQIVPNTASFEF